MIARMWQGAVRLADADVYADYIRETGFAEYGRTHGASTVTHWQIADEIPPGS